MFTLSRLEAQSFSSAMKLGGICFVELQALIKQKVLVADSLRNCFLWYHDTRIRMNQE